MQSFHMDEQNLTDIKYNFMVGGDGAIYEGRGWNFECEDFGNYNEASISISFIGKFIEVLPTQGQLNATHELIKEGVRIGKLAKDYVLYGHCQVVDTLSPGRALYRLIKTWDHWQKLSIQY